MDVIKNVYSSRPLRYSPLIAKLSRAQVNSWRLSKHHLTKRSSKNEMAEVVSEICGVQAQVMSGAELGIWARVDGITAQDVKDALWNDRQLVKTWCMRGTLHLLKADDLPLYVAALKTRTVYKSRPWLRGHGVSLEEIDKITSETRDALNGRCLTREELAASIVKKAGFKSRVKRNMLSGWGSLLHPAAHQGNLCFGPNRGKNVTFVRPDQWLGRWDEPGGDEALRTLAARFVAAYGPCSAQDFNHWWNVLQKDAGRIFQSMSDELEEVEFEGRKTLIRRIDVKQITSSKPAKSLRLLPSFDPYIMFYNPRELLVEQRFRTKVFRQLAGWVSPVLLIDGAAAGIWRYKRQSSRVGVTVEPFRSLSADEQDQVEQEATSLGQFTGTTTQLNMTKRMIRDS